jgi:hypothetical protein
MLLSGEAVDLPASVLKSQADADELKLAALPAKGRSVGVALTTGRGRVVMIGEPGMMTAEIVTDPDGASRKVGMNVAGNDNAQFTLSVVRWLGGALEDVQVAAAPVPASVPATPAPTAVPTPVAAAHPDFTGTWKLATQETSAFRGQGTIGNFEEPVRIVQTASDLAIEYESSDPTGRFHYDLTADPEKRADSNGEETWSSSRWDGTTLVTHGRRLFTTPKGPKAFDFSEERKLKDGGSIMHVKTRIEMWPSDLVRTSEYRRAP